VVLLALPPAEGGRHSWGLAHEYLAEPVAAARTVIAEIGEHVPVTGGPTLAADRVDVAVPVERAPVELASPAPDPVTAAVADRVAALVDDGAALQVGVGAVPQQVLARLGDRRDLRIRSGAIVDQVVDLAEAGALATGRDEPAVQGGILMGTRRVMGFADRNPEVELLPTGVTHARATMAAQHGLVAVNSAIEVDLLGQIGSEVAGGRYVGAIGGSLDFARGAHASPGGVPVTALPSTARGSSRIVAALSGPCTIGRADAGVVVTEHGVADLRGRTEAQRAELLLAVAHPDHRPALAAAADALLRARRTTL
jgi:acetyl-CoA hydrolase